MKRIFKSPVFWGVLAVLVIIVPQLGIYDFIGTDCFHVGFLEGVLEYPGFGPFNLYRFANGDPEHMSDIISNNFFPWFSSLDWKLIFCRHLPSLLIALNHKICGLKPLGYIIHSLLWYMLLIAVLGFLMGRIAPGSESKRFHPAAYLAVIIFAFSTSHMEIVFLGSARWMLITTTFALAGLVFHLKWREQGWKPGRYLSLLAIFLALLSGEAALALLAYLAAYELFGSGEPLEKRIKALLPAAVLVVIYLLFYRLMDYGVGGQDLYINPLADPLAFLTDLPLKLASILAEMFFGIMSILWIDPLAPSQMSITFLAGAGALVICGLLFYPVWLNASIEQRRRFRWVIFGSIGAMIPLASGYPCSRVAMIPFIGGSVLLAFIMHYWWKKLTKKSNFRRNLKSPFAWIGGLVCIVLFFVHLLLYPYCWFAIPWEYNKIFDKEREFNRKSTVLNEIQPHQEAIFLQPSADIDLNYGVYFYRKLNRLPLPGSWWQLSYSWKKHRYLRTAKDKLELDLSGSGMFEGHTWVYVLRSKKEPLKTGEVIKLPGLQIRIIEVNENGPTRMEFKFDRSLDDERYCFFKFHEGSLVPVPLPPVGEVIDIQPVKPDKPLY